MSDEVTVHSLQAVRKGRGRRPCEVKVALSDDGHVVLRTVDESGISPIVVLIQPDQATELSEGLLRAAHALRQGRTSAAQRRHRPSISG